MKNKTIRRIYFIFLTILFGIYSQTFSIESYQINATLTQNNYSKTSEIENLFKENLEEFNKITTYSQVPRGLVLSIDSTIFFAPNTLEIQEISKEFLDKIGQTLKQLDKPCIIEGNAKVSNPDTLNFDTNWEISTYQAQKLSDYLIKVHNINPQKIRTIGFGETIPSGLTQRIDFVILN